MLISENFRRSHETRLEPVVYGQDNSHKRNNSLSTSNIALYQSIHVCPLRNIIANFLDHTFLGIR